jgi:glyoxylase-like metal-dependent hydrolase (beta-lactamase superfamily II)
MQGWTVTQKEPVSIHTFTAPEDGWLVNSHIIELPSQLFVIDAQYTLPFASEVVRYAHALGKALSRLYVTHYHPDHILGASAFDAPLCALQQVAAKIAAVGDRVAREEHEKIGDGVPITARRPDRRIEEGDEIVDGVRLQYRRLRCAETEDALTVALPDASLIIVQDLVYNQVHPFLGERRFDSWRAGLDSYRTLPFETVLPGHGQPGGREVYDEMLRYLDAAEQTLEETQQSPAFRAGMIQRFPDYAGLKVLDHQLRFLFPEMNHA